MPKRSNDFQRLIYLVRLNLSEGARVSESKMMRDRLTKRFREVDVVVEGKVGSQPVYVSIECRDHQRVADVSWVDAMKAKHDRLDTNVLLLASRSGFTPEARDVASKYGIEAFTLEDIDDHDIHALLGPNGELWLKSVTITAEKVSIRVAQVGLLASETVATNPDNLLYLEDGTELCQTRELVDGLLKTPRARDYLLAEGNDEHKWFEFVWEPPSDQQGRPLYMKKIEPEVMRPVESIRVIGPCKVEIAKFGVRHGKIGDVQVAWGKVTIAGNSAMAVATKTDTGETKLSVNFSGAAK
ncbi:MAG TPA: hypothetical protein PLX20_10335 [Rhodocyclaceae bacterium]|nr:hypothetical protein [Rhodocyclaceae bacterium]HMV53995.1 hypothetical protein [Rhodocyclaceae bacterium]HMZ83789.1 hypothetical protein [Rhodocyclaceae bacterium]HNA04353.1 hypothetical protein [Rhodocyclaceae bacterium]HNB78816.1 hypothetical protein [Rhodocyclaceae bacterium]